MGSNTIGEVTILKPGVCTTIQDLGRFGFRDKGVPCAGPMDVNSFLLANRLLGNEDDCAVLEWGLLPPVLKFSIPTSVSVTGCDVEVFLNDQKLGFQKVIQVGRGDILRFNKCKNCVYGYVGVVNGFLTQSVLGSRSSFNGISTEVRVQKNHILPYDGDHRNVYNKVQFTHTNVACMDQFIEVYKGPEFDRLSKENQNKIFDKNFVVSDLINRMAIQLQTRLENSLSPIVSGPVLPGTVQLTLSGLLMVLMKDCQTMGGYPRILQLTEEAMDKIAQIPPREEIRFMLREF